jgi:hypothetical protein
MRDGREAPETGSDANGKPAIPQKSNSSIEKLRPAPSAAWSGVIRTPRRVSVAKLVNSGNHLSVVPMKWA